MSVDIQQHPPSDLSEQIFTINLILKRPDGISVRSCELIGKRFRNRTSFADRSHPDDILHERLARRVRQSLDDLPEGPQILSFPDLVIELPGLTLAGLTIMVMDARDGIASVIFRFREFIGNLSRAFRHDVGIGERFATHSERLSISVLTDICLPLLNLARGMELAYLQQGAQVPAQLSDRAREFEFQTELLKRYIFNSARRSEAEAAAADRQLRLG